MPKLLATNQLMPQLKQEPTSRNAEDLFIYLFGVLHRFQHCTGHITTDSWKGRGNQYIQFVRVLYCKLPTNGKQLPAFPLEAVPGIEPRPQRWEARVLPLCHRGPLKTCSSLTLVIEGGHKTPTMKFEGETKYPNQTTGSFSSVIYIMYHVLMYGQILQLT